MKNLYKLFSIIFITVLTIQSIVLVPSGTAATQDWYGRVTNISDGDTIDVAWEGPDAHPSNTVRVAGIDTNEVASSQCFADAATTRLEELIPVGSRIKLVANDINSSSLGRSLRHVFYGPGLNTNVAVTMIREGLGLPISYANEPDYRYWYFRYGEQAMLDKVGMWAENACGGAAYSSSDLEMFVNYDADGDDRFNINGEFIELKNNGSSTLDISNWIVRGSGRLGGENFTLPSGRSIFPGATHKILSGSGTNTSTKTYLGSNNAWLNNDSDVVYVRDAFLNLRAAKFWPCVLSCIPEASIIVEDVQYDSPGNDNTNPNGEWIRLRNVGNRTVYLNNWQVRDNSKGYRFGTGDKMFPGQSLVVYIGSGTDTANRKYWGNSSGILNNSGNDIVEVVNPDSKQIDCYDWKSQRCYNENIRGAIRVYANFDASGTDLTNPNGEWISLHNTSSSVVWVSNHKIYIAGQGTYQFPLGSKIGPGENLRLRIGKGTNDRYNQYWGKSSGIMNNGGGYVVFTTWSNIALEQHSWPCDAYCGYDFGLKIDKVNYNAPGDDSKNPNGEWIDIKNTSAATQNLRNWKIRVGPNQLVSVAGRSIQPGASVRIYIGKGTNTSSKMYWGKSSGILYNSGSLEVELLSPLRHDADCFAWGSGSC